ncbi:MAG: hypothetical protein K1X56_02560 [Flavobacteriales bacterium]|nr:hypothetical protein [Flavobacteriales bacterium]
MKSILLLSGFLFLGYHSASASNFASPDTTLSVLDKGVIAAKMVEAKNKQYAGDYRGALNTYREIIAEDKTNALAHFKIAECHFELSHWDLSLEYVEKAFALDPATSPEIEFLWGKVLHRLEKLDDAKTHLEKYKSTIKPEKLADSDIDFYLSQVKTAKEVMAKALNVTIKNAGTHINSKFDDYSPVIAPAGNIIYFTSRRPQSTGGMQAEDNTYFEDIFYCKLNEDGTWTEAEQVEGKLNSDEFDNCSHISADGTTMYITQNINRYTKSSDLAVSKMSKSGKWNMAKLLPKPINSSYFDACPTLSPDEKTLYFVSERNGEKFGSDVFKATKNGSKWSTPIPCPSLNSTENETTVWLHPNGKWLFFSSKGFNSMGGYDIYVAEWTGTDWGNPRNLGYPINTVNDETHFRISPDGKYAFMSSNRPGGVGERDIYMIDLSTIEWLK